MMGIPDFSLTGKMALVTGARKGIGKEIALAFAEAGADVALCDLVTDDGKLNGVAEEIERFGRRSIAIKADTSRKSDVENMVRKVMDQFGAIDILVNNAGIIIRGPLLDMPEDEWDRLIDVDLKGQFLCAQAVGRKMVERKKGNIINISTQYAFRAPEVGMGAYAVAKAGVVMLTRVLAQELGHHGIRANSIAPGLARTDFSRATWSNGEVLKQIETSLPLGRIAETGDFVGAALFLASDASSYVTGHTILMEGGGLA
jgi:NAD(P)-dependent dehydrogenase (short-subunit alcohol dehydrogenase family)